jgi:carboxymethylenebutenolidase
MLWAMAIIRVSSAEGSFDALIRRPREPTCPAVVLLHEMLGLNADMRATCEELAAAGFTAICPDLFWRRQYAPDSSSYEAFDVDAGVRDVESTVAAARRLSNGRVAVMGFCLGGLLSFLAAARTVVDAAVAFYGGRTEEYLAEAADIDSPLQMHLAGEDEFMGRDAQRRIAAALPRRADIELHGYAGCRHAFSRHDGLHFDPEAARLSRARTLEFLYRHLG